MQFIIYMIYNDVNSDIYIGQTTTSLEQRWREHLRDASYDDFRKLYVGMRYYGIEKFHIKEIDRANSIEELDALEKYYIAKYDSFSHGYNSSMGGEFHPNNKKVTLKIHPEYLTILDEYSSVSEAAVQNSPLKQSDISACCLNPTKIMRGFRWSHKKTYDWFVRQFLSKYKLPPNAIIPKRLRGIIQTDLNCRIINVYQNVFVASEQTGIPTGSITSCCNGNSTFAGHYNWYFIDMHYLIHKPLKKDE